MKLYLSVVVLLWTMLAGFAQVEETHNGKSVFIVNSYREEVLWSNETATAIKLALERSCPELHVYIGNLNIDELANQNTLWLKQRAVIWQMAEERGDTINAEDLSKYTVFKLQKQPDVIVFIGEEGWFFHRSTHLFQGKWREIPVVLCAMNDSVTDQVWLPGTIADFSKMENVTESFTFFSPESRVRMKVRDIPLVEYAGERGYLTRFHGTGVISSVPVRENLELLKQLIPGLQEIVWVDDDYYRANYAYYRLRQEVPNIFPGVKISSMIHNKMNTDSIYDVILTPSESRAYITYSLNINGLYSRRNEHLIDSIFNHNTHAPILTLTERNFRNSFWLGGYYNFTSECVSQTVDRILRILDGENPDTIPFAKTGAGNIQLDMTAIKRYGLTKQVAAIEQVTYKNVPLDFYQKHEGVLLVSMLVVALLGGGIIQLVRKRRFVQNMKAEYIDYRKLYDRLQVIYENTSIDFALYDTAGGLIFRIINGEERPLEEDEKEILSASLFTNPYFSSELKEQIRQNDSVSREIQVCLNTNKFESVNKDTYHLIINPLPSDKYQIIRYMVILVNLTSLMQEKQKKERFEGLFRFASDTSRIGIASYNLLTGRGFATRTWYMNLNEPKEEGVLPAYLQVIPEDRERLCDYRESVAKEHLKTPFIKNIQVYGPEGEKHWIKQYIFVREFAPEKGRITVIELNLNYDQQKEVENQLQQAKRQAEIANLETEKFLADISHEIRTPLNAIVGFSSILASSDDVEGASELAGIIERNNELLVTLIDNILQLAQLEAGIQVLEYTHEDLYEVFESLTCYTKSNLTSSEVQVINEAPAKSELFCTDADRFKLIMTNLLSNAIKFTAIGSITLGYHKKETQFYFYVKDTGCGIRREDQKRVFNRFEKLDTFTQGSGLGLALCRSIVTCLGGQIGVSSEPGKGTLFWFILPIKKK